VIVRRSFPFIGVMLAVVGVLAVAVASPSAAATSPNTYIGLGAASLATPVAGGRYIYVATTGTDTVQSWNRFNCLDDPGYIGSGASSQSSCPEPSKTAPLATIELAIRIAKPGDVIVVRGGIYREAIGWSARKGTASKPIIMQAYPGERVEVNGTLILRSPNYWTIQGFHFTHNKTIQTGQAIVAIAGGTHWTFANNEVAGSTGDANLLIVSDTATASTVAAKTAAAPQNYAITGNCIHTNAGSDTQGTDHNIYLMTSVYSVGGVIDHNFIAGAPRGSNIKAAASSSATANDSPHNVLIEYNTMLYAASGVTVGLKAQGVSIEHNLIALASQSQANDGGVKTYQLAAPGTNAVKDTLIVGYTSPIHEDWGVTAHIFAVRNDTTSPVSFVGSVANCSVRPTSSTLMNRYGQYAGL
jgi:hypothetical protein